MRLRKILVLLPCLFFYLQLHAQESTYLNDLKTVLNYLGHGSYTQFQSQTNLVALSASTPMHWYAFKYDEHYSHTIPKQKFSAFGDSFGALGVLLNFPVIPGIAYYYAQQTQNQRLKSFALEYTASLYLALIESGVISFIHIHDRPDKRNLSFWERGFRGDSSYPSGHVIPFWTLTFKAMQFYGPTYALPSFFLSLLSSWQRMHDKKHYLSDVVGGMTLAFFSSHGVALVANSKQNHPTYQWMIKHDLSFNLFPLDQGLSGKVSWTF